ncbi:MAG TPA: 4Fe-4S ferredoxin [Firmicutes bacterium]|nr:4Fe-4S ferredoxin [Bacillota bacterium]
MHADGDPLQHTTIKVAHRSHIALKDPQGCGRCRDRACVAFCPSGVYAWQAERLTVDYRRCIECLACPFACPSGNIVWHYPPGGYGVIYHY